MLQQFIRFPEFAEFTESSSHLGKTPMSISSAQDFESGHSNQHISLALGITLLLKNTTQLSLIDQKFDHQDNYQNCNH